MTKFGDLAPKWLSKLMLELGLDDYQAAGLLGNLAYESGGFENLQEIKPTIPGSRGGTGVAMWTAGRRRAFEAWSAERGLSTTSDEANYGFLLHELNGDYTSTITALKRTKTLGAAVFSVGQTYERPAGTTPEHLPGYEGRLAYAKRALAGAADVPIHPDLRLGASGPAVAELQRRLTALGFPCGAIDADFGKLTDEAAERFMKAAGVWPGVMIDGSTWNALAKTEAERI